MILKRHSDALERDLKFQEEAISTFKTQNEELNLRVKTMVLESTEYKRKYQDLAHEKETLQATHLADISKKNAEWEAERTTAATLHQRELSKKKTELEELKSSHLAHKTAHGELKETEEQLRGQIQALLAEKVTSGMNESAKVAEYTNQVSLLTEKNTEAETVIAVLQKDLSAYQDKIKLIEHDLEEKKKQVQELLRDAEKSKNEGSQLKELGEMLEKEKVERKKAEEAKAAFEGQCDILDEEIKNVKFTKGKIERDNQLLEKKVNKKELELKSALEENEKLKKRAAECEAECEKAALPKEEESASVRKQQEAAGELAKAKELELQFLAEISQLKAQLESHGLTIRERY